MATKKVINTVVREIKDYAASTFGDTCRVVVTWKSGNASISLIYSLNGQEVTHRTVLNGGQDNSTMALLKRRVAKELRLQARSKPAQ